MVRQTAQQFPEFTWDEVSQPGCYVAQDGDLYSVPSASIGPVQRLTAKSQRNPMTVTLISSDPHLSISQARQLSLQAGIQPNF